MLGKALEPLDNDDGKIMAYSLSFVALNNFKVLPTLQKNYFFDMIFLEIFKKVFFNYLVFPNMEDSFQIWKDLNTIFLI